MRLSETFVNLSKLQGQNVTITLTDGSITTGFLDAVEYDEDGDFFILDDVIPKGALDYGLLSNIATFSIVDS